MSLRLRLPATSANLGPGFDALGLAMTLYLTVEAEAAEAFAIDARGLDAELVGRLDGNLMLQTYGELAASGRERDSARDGMRVERGGAAGGSDAGQPLWRVEDESCGGAGRGVPARGSPG